MKRRKDYQIMFDLLESLEWAMVHFDGYLPRGKIEKKYINVLKDKGFAESIGLAYQTDGNGLLLEGRQMREAFVLTEHGRQALDLLRGTCGDSGYPNIGHIVVIDGCPLLVAVP